MFSAPHKDENKKPWSRVHHSKSCPFTPNHVYNEIVKTSLFMDMVKVAGTPADAKYRYMNFCICAGCKIRYIKLSVGDLDSHD